MAQHIVIHGCAPPPEGYAWFVGGAILSRMMVLIECASADVPAWRAIAKTWGREAEIAVIAAGGED